MKAPIPYAAELEVPEDGEAETVEGLLEALQGIADTTAKDYGHAVRAVHAKSHGLIEVEMTVLDGLAPQVAQGLFSRAASYPAILRISTNPGDLLDDAISAPRGMALKILGVEGARLPGPERTSQDFVMVNGPAFVAKDAAGFLGSLKLLARTTDRAEGAKKILSAVLRGVERGIEAVGGESATIKSLGGAPNVHPLGETYYSQTPFRFGDHVAKLSLAPVSPGLTAHTGEIVETRGRPDALRESIAADMQSGAGEWDLRVQLCRDLETMPIEDASVVWPEDESPFVTVAKVRAAPQIGWSEARAKVVDDGMRFSVWNGLEAHRPLGSVNRARRATYDMSARLRERRNGCPITEPAGAHLPD